MQLKIKSTEARQVIDITDTIAAQLQESTKLVSLLILHTTAALTTADLDPGTDQDLLDALFGMLPQQQWRHPHNPAHAPAHLLSSIIGPGLSLPASNGKLQLGTWQRVVLIELDGPRERLVELKLQ